MLNPFLVSFFSLSSSRSQWTTLCALQAPCWSVSKPACANLLGFWCTPVGIASFTMSTSFLPCWPCSPACLTPKSEHSDTPALCLVSTEVQYSRKNRESIHTQTNFTSKVFFMTLLYFLNWGENLQPNRCWRYQRVSSCFSGGRTNCFIQLTSVLVAREVLLFVSECAPPVSPAFVVSYCCPSKPQLIHNVIRQDIIGQYLPTCACQKKKLITCLDKVKKHYLLFTWFYIFWAFSHEADDWAGKSSYDSVRSAADHPAAVRHGEQQGGSWQSPRQTGGAAGHHQWGDAYTNTDQSADTQTLSQSKHKGQDF